MHVPASKRKKLLIQTCNKTLPFPEKSGGCKRNAHWNKHIRNNKKYNGNISLFGRNLQWNIAYQGRNIIDHVDLKHKLIASFTRRNVKYKVTVDRISSRYCVKSQKSFIVCIVSGWFFFIYMFINFFWKGGGANAHKFMCTFYRISYIYLMHLPINANRFSSSWIKIQSNWEIGAGCSGYIIVCKAAI